MARNDTGRWVARAAATGGGRSYRGQRPLKWYGSLVLICLVGVALIWFSRYERQNPSSSGQPAVGTKWVAAIAFDICGVSEPNLPTNPNLTASPAPGITTQGDGLIHVSPTRSADAGANATLGRFVDSYPGLTLTSASLRVPGHTRTTGRSWHDGENCPRGTPDAGKAGQVTVAAYSNYSQVQKHKATIVSNPPGLLLLNGQLITVAFLPNGATIPKPTKQIVPLLNAMEAANSGTTTTTTPAATTTTPTSTTKPGSTTSTTKPGSTTSTSAGTTTSTTAPKSSTSTTAAR